MIEVSASILNMEEGKESDTILNLEKARTDYIHIDVMDGKFVQKNTYQKMFENASYVKRLSNLPLDVHLMIQDVEKGIKDFSDIKPNMITFHLEACRNDEEVFKMINLIKENNSKVGIAIKPNTKIEQMYKYLQYIHCCLIMTVEPGLGGQTLLLDMVDKVKTLKEYIDKNNLEIDIEVDGGINLKTCDSVKKAGANILVSGVAILMAKNYKEIIDVLKK